MQPSPPQPEWELIANGTTGVKSLTGAGSNISLAFTNGTRCNWISHNKYKFVLDYNVTATTTTSSSRFRTKGGQSYPSALQNILFQVGSGHLEFQMEMSYSYSSEPPFILLLANGQTITIELYNVEIYHYIGA